jgi:tetratricopeptide (TPR) repeat protein
MKLKLVALSTIASASALTGCVTTPEPVKEVVKVAPQVIKLPSPRENFDQGVAAFDAGKLDEAKALFTKVAEKAPNNIVTQYNLGVIAERQGRLSDAQGHYEAARKLDPKHKPTLLNLGKVYRLQDKFTEAIALYEEALKADEFDVELNNNLTVAYRLAKNYAKAEETARRVLSRTKDNPDAYKNLSLIYFDQGNLPLAQFISANAKKLDEKDPGVYNNLGLIYLQQQEKRQALAQFQKAVTLNKDFSPSLFNIGAMALSYRDYLTAEKNLGRTTELDPTRYENFLAYAWALDGQKGKDPKKGLRAGEVFEKVLSLKADQGEAICGAAWAYASDKTGWDKALGFFEKCKALPGTTEQDQKLIDNKVKGILAMQKSGQQAPKEPEKAKPVAPTGPSMLDKAEKEAESAPPEATPPAGETPPAGATPPAGGTTPPPAGAKPAPATDAAPAAAPAKPEEKK